MIVPLNILPGWLGTVANALPWAAMVQVPADVYLGKDRPGARAGLPARLGGGAARRWARSPRRAARRKVVIQGG